MRSRMVDLLMLLVVLSIGAMVWHFREHPTHRQFQSERQLADEALKERDFRAAVSHLQHCVRMARQMGDRELEHEALDDLGWSYFELGDLEQAAKFQQEAVLRAEEAHGPDNPKVALYLARLTRVTPDPKLAREYLARAEAIYRRTFPPGPDLEAALAPLEEQRKSLAP
ncbi:MAG: hypothetical protein AMXMBFR33_43500 [Candidatus Xenobia bacterium]